MKRFYTLLLLATGILLASCVRAEESGQATMEKAFIISEDLGSVSGSFEIAPSPALPTGYFGIQVAEFSILAPVARIQTVKRTVKPYRRARDALSYTNS